MTDTVSGSALVWSGFGILTFVVLNDELLLSFFDALPISLERDVKERVESKNYLSWSCLHRGVNQRMNYLSHCC